MLEMDLGRLARARVWFDVSRPPPATARWLVRRASGDPHGLVHAEHVTLEAVVPHGGIARYGLLGVGFRRGAGTLLEVHVPVLGDEGVHWPDALGAPHDDVRLGLPEEYAPALLETLAQGGTNRLPPGTLDVVRAAHGAIGSSRDFFGRLAAAVLDLMTPPAPPDDALVRRIVQHALFSAT